MYAVRRSLPHVATANLPGAEQRATAVKTCACLYTSMAWPQRLPCECQAVCRLPVARMKLLIQRPMLYSEITQSRPAGHRNGTRAPYGR